MLEQYIHPLLNYLHAHPQIGLLFAFLVSFAESLPLVGTIFPGTVTMTIVGVLIGNGTLPGLTAIIMTSVAAFLGDCIGFAVGYWYNDRIRTVWPFKKYPRFLETGEAFFRKHGGKSIIIGRFFGPMRSAMPLIAGVMKMTWPRFCIAAFPSAIAWAIAYLIPGMILGAISREIPHGKMGEFLIFGLIFLIAVFFGLWLIQHFFLQLARAINMMTDRLWNYLFHKRSCRPFIRCITNHQHPRDHHQLTLLIAALFSAALFFILLVNVRIRGSLIALNEPIFHLLQNIRTPLFDKLLVVISIIGSPPALMLSAGIAFITLMLLKQMRAAGHVLIALLASMGTVTFFKSISHSLRPQGFEVVSHSSSFPSGHTTFTFMITSVIAFLITQITPKDKRWIPFVIAGIAILAVGFSRLYLGAHWFTDIIGSIFLGFSVLLFCIISYRRMPRARGALQLSLHQATLILCFTFLLPPLIFIPKDFSDQLFHTKPAHITQQISESAWWRSPLAFTPTYRNNRLGKPFQPFNVQWASDLDHIQATLTQQGWKIVEKKPKLKTTLQRFAHFNAEYHIPILPWLYHNQPPVLFMIKHIPKTKSIIELRLWQSNIVFQNNGAPLWLGAVNYREPPEKLMSLKNRTTISLKNGAGIDQLFDDTKNFKRKMILVTTTYSALDHALPLQWDGKVLLVK